MPVSLDGENNLTVAMSDPSDRHAVDEIAFFTGAYVVRAVSPGRYVHPQAFVEDMYRPDRFGRTASGTVEVTAVK